MILSVTAGLVPLVPGATLPVRGAAPLATAVEIRAPAIGSTVVAFGASTPELAVELGSASSGGADLADGYVVGSDLSNRMGVRGLSAAVAPAGGLQVADSVLSFDLPVMAAVAVACLSVLFTQHRIARREGLPFVAHHAADTTFLALQQTRHDALEGFRSVMATFALPLTVVMLAVPGYRAWRRR
jgi:cation:H+ antiporter